MGTVTCCCDKHHQNYGRCLQCPIHGMKPPITTQSTGMTTHFNLLTPAEAERLALLLEEMGEAQQVIGKILRHGYGSRHPNGGPTNRALLEKEMADVEVALHMLIHACDINKRKIARFRAQKRLTVSQFLHHQI